MNALWLATGDHRRLFHDKDTGMSPHSGRPTPETLAWHNTSSEKALLSVRSALIFTIATVIGVAVGALGLWAGFSVPELIIAACAAFGSAVAFLNAIIG
ncbi:hypothetical protein FH608_039135 [Nonomuraea phyllanthi]|uniref:Uncharacterized protein n=1 Tax=Nonomuraea phyllanthi TaxID=2219224 RepID=A0A5C4VMQ5_9ACTN|nr:hypothetical protein [Nonomuraea phyllanthi]KAB8189607.1 hypothetical protein FH608_039135 [Nonomuraea phyllanthi]QFY12041.1 hypothetical protein GBF35_40600 [Nonomuraea phyllanthi]